MQVTAATVAQQFRILRNLAFTIFFWHIELGFAVLGGSAVLLPEVFVVVSSLKTGGCF